MNASADREQRPQQPVAQLDQMGDEGVLLFSDMGRRR